jgi:protein-tyrosine kinase
MKLKHNISTEHRRQTGSGAEKRPVELLQKPIKESCKTAPGSEMMNQNGFGQHIVTLSDPASFDAENFKLLAAELTFPRKGEKRRVIMVTSAFPQEGKSYVSANLAASIALGINKRVVLMDCDLRRPSLHLSLDCPNRAGVYDLLNGEKEFNDLIIQTRIENLSLLPAGKISANPTQLFSSGRMVHFLDEFKKRNNDTLIIDAPPSQFLSETKILADHVDGILFVIMAFKSHRDAVKTSLENLGKDKVFGIFFNGDSKSHSRYHKYYKNYYVHK